MWKRLTAQFIQSPHGACRENVGKTGRANPVTVSWAFWWFCAKKRRHNSRDGLMKAFGGNVEKADRAIPAIAARRLTQEHWENRPCKFRDCAMTPVGGTVQKGDDTISAMVS